MHYRDIITIRISTARDTRIGQAGVFCHGQGVHVCPQQDGGSLAVSHHTDDTCTADTRDHVESERDQVVRDDPCGAVFRERKFWVAV
jgi:hypothetical protein